MAPSSPGGFGHAVVIGGSLAAYGLKRLFVPLSEWANVDTLPSAPGQSPAARDAP
jgi:hypothetical protein